MKMPDLPERFQRFDGLPAPSLWPDIDARARVSEAIKPPADRRAKIVTILVALFIAAASTAFVIGAFHEGTRVPASQDVGIFEGVRGWIAFSEHSSGGRFDHQISALDPQGEGRMVQLFETPGDVEAWPLDWSAAGDRLLIQERTRTPGGFRDKLVVLSGDGRETFVARSPGGSLTPDGEGVVFVSERGISVIGVDGQDERQHLLVSNDLDRPVSSPAVSPDGTRIAYVLGSGGKETVMTVAADGTDSRSVLDVAPLGITGIYGLSWSPDGASLAIGGATDPASKGITGSIWIVDVGSGDARQLDNGMDVSLFPSWSPDGSMIAYESESPEHVGVLAVMQADGSGSRQIATGHIHPVWNGVGDD
jgi:WD40 repeat protein